MRSKDFMTQDVSDAGLNSLFSCGQSFLGTGITTPFFHIT